jgi:hypothetical protein
MQRATRKTTTARVTSRRGNVVTVAFGSPEPPKPAAPGARLPRPWNVADAIAEDHPSVLYRDDPIMRAFGFGRRRAA